MSWHDWTPKLLGTAQVARMVNHRRRTETGSFLGGNYGSVIYESYKARLFIFRDIDIDIHKALIMFKLLTELSFVYAFVCVFTIASFV